tara:strand:- start:56 stop:208 length:153 start_codon:yes stop_codon:yes gene_type:complete
MVIFCESSEDKDASLEFDFSSFKQKRKMKTKLENRKLTYHKQRKYIIFVI